MNVALIGAELEENLAIRYIASSLEVRGHNVEIVPFNAERDTESAVGQTLAFEPQIVGLSMIFTSRGREFCQLAKRLREAGFRGHLIAGGPFASFNCEFLVNEFPDFNSVALGEGEELMCCLAENLDHLDRVPGLCYRDDSGLAADQPTYRQSRQTRRLALAQAHYVPLLLRQAHCECPHQSRVLARLRLLQYQRLV